MHSHTQTNTPPSLVFPYIAVVHLGPLQKEREEEREREETKEGERGQVLVVTTALPPLLSCLYHHIYDNFLLQLHLTCRVNL